VGASRRGAGTGDPTAARGWIDPGWDVPAVLAGDAGAALGALFALVPGRWLRRLPARATFAWRPAGAAAALVVKRFSGDELSERWYERLRGRTPRSPAEREAASLASLRAAGMPAPRPLAWFAGRGASAVVMEHLEHRETLRELLEREGAPRARARLAHLARLVARLHAAGFYHRDLYLEHVVVRGAEPEDLALLDAGRARRERAPRERWRVKDLAALELSTPARVGAVERLRFLARYLDARGVLDRGRRRAFARAVRRKAARLARHAPRHVHRPDLQAPAAPGACCPPS
jgi:tRNA A-37 threonylcarbamoyl transferase component Bud32